jgi:hypothetical protein
MAKRTLPNRGYIFEAVWAAAVAARFYKRFGKVQRWQRMKEVYAAKGLTQVGRLPPVNYSDVVYVLQELFSQSSHSLATQTQNDIRWDVDIQDYLNVQIGVPADVDRLLTGYARQRNFSEIRDFIRSSASLANAHSRLNQQVRAVAFNGYTDTITVTADGLVDQRDVKADVTVTISTQDPNIQDVRPFAVSCKVPGGEQFAQVSGGEWQKFEDLFGTIGVEIPMNVKNQWEESMQQYLSEDIFSKRYATRQAIEATNIPTHVKNAAKRVYRGVANSMNSNFPKQSFVSYIINGFSNGVDTELVKLVGKVRGGEMYMSGGKTLRVDDTFRQLLLTLNYSAEYKETEKSSMILIKVDGVNDPIMQFRYKWENPSSGSGRNKTYRMYPRHYLEALDGMFDIDPRTQKVSI